MNKKRIALIVDEKNWAFDIEANLLKEKLNDYYDVDVFVSSEYDNDLFKILLDVKDFDLIHFFWRKLLLELNDELFIKKLNDNNIDIKELLNKLSTGIYDHLFLDLDSINLYKDIFNKYVYSYYTCSKKLEDIYINIKDYKNPFGTIHDTYDNKLYKNEFTYKKKNNNDELVIGWVGNSNWNIKYKDFKGFHTIIKPVLEELKNEGYLIKEHFADRNILFRTNEEMPSYYKEIDLCLITSISEGTPRPIIEAMASNVPIITTDVGITTEVFGQKQKEYIIGDRNKDSDDVIKERLKEKIIYLYNNRNILYDLAYENYLNASNNDIDHLCLKYKEYFDSFFE